jgi:hypothetical protein
MIFQKLGRREAMDYIKDMAILADRLDEIGLLSEADFLDQALIKLSGAPGAGADVAAPISQDYMALEDWNYWWWPKIEEVTIGGNVVRVIPTPVSLDSKCDTQIGAEKDACRRWLNEQFEPGDGEQGYTRGDGTIDTSLWSDSYDSDDGPMLGSEAAITAAKERLGNVAYQTHQDSKGRGSGRTSPGLTLLKGKYKSITAGENDENYPSFKSNSNFRTQALPGTQATVKHGPEGAEWRGILGADSGHLTRGTTSANSPTPAWVKIQYAYWKGGRFSEYKIPEDRLLEELSKGGTLDPVSVDFMNLLFAGPKGWPPRANSGSGGVDRVWSRTYTKRWFNINLGKMILELKDRLDAAKHRAARVCSPDDGGPCQTIQPWLT